MLPGSVDNLFRLAGIVISAILAAQPWLMTTGSEDPFLFSTWGIFAAGSIAACLLSVILPFFRPRRGQIVFISGFFLLFAATVVATLNSSFFASLRSSMYLVTLMLLAIFLRLTRKQKDNAAIAGMIAMSGTAMAICGLLQLAGYDPLTWSSSSLMFDTFTNPDYLGAFLVICSIITFGLIQDQGSNRRSRIVFSVFLVLQLTAILLAGKPIILMCLLLAIFLNSTSFWEIRPGRFLRRSPLVAGLLLAIISTSFYGLSYFATSSYPWGSISKMPQNHMPVITRLVLWQMGFGIFTDHPITGLGPGSVAYLMPSQRPPQGSMIGITAFNDDPHSAVVSLLAEIGFFGLWGVGSLIAALYGCFVWRRSKEVSNIVSSPSENLDAIPTLKEPQSETPTPAPISVADTVSAEVKTEIPATTPATTPESSPEKPKTEVPTPSAADISKSATEEPKPETETAPPIQPVVQAAAEVTLAVTTPENTAQPSETAEIQSNAAEATAEANPVAENYFPWSATAVFGAVSYLAFRANFISMPVFFYSVPLIIAFFGITSAIAAEECKMQPEHDSSLNKATMIASLSFVFYSFFNNSVSIIPLSGFAVLIFSLHFSSCQRDLAWKRKFSPIAILFLLLPPLYVYCSYIFQIAHHREQINLWKGQSLLASGQASEAEKAFNRAVNSNPQSLKAYYGLAMSLEKQNRPDETQDILKRLDAMVPNAFNSNYELARIMLSRRQILEAHRHALKNLEWDKTPSSYELLGKILMIEGRSGEAEKIFREGLGLYPVSTIEREAADRIRLNLAAIAAGRGDFARCEELLKQIRSDVITDVNNLYLTGLLLARKKDYDQALEIFEKALDLFPQNPRFMNAIGFILSETDTDLDRAQNLLENAHQIIGRADPVDLADLLMVAHSLGKLYWKQGKTAQAGELLKIAWEQCPEEWAALREERLIDYVEFCKKNGLEPPKW